ncbi:MAG: CocE/NonD family hydrolase [Mycobacterium sp.]
MRAARYVGRVGGLTVFLGVGAAVGCGTAWADSGADQHVAPSVAHVASTTAHLPRQTSRPARQRSTAPRAGAAVRRAPVRPTAKATGSSVSSAPITVNPSVAWNEGVLTGTLGATSDLPLSYSVVSRPSLGGKLGEGPLLPLTNFGPEGQFTYVPYASTLTDPTQTETFQILALQNSQFDQFVEKLLGPLGAVLVPQVVAVLHRIPVVGELLSPIIGAAEVVTFTVNPFDEAAGRPTAFTYKMPSFDGTLISVNYFPALNVSTGSVSSAPTVLAASGLASIASTDPTNIYGQLFPSEQFGSVTPGIAPLRSDSYTSELLDGPTYNGGGGYNVITWDPRGEFASGGQLQIDNPFYEGRDVSSIINWLTSAANPAVAQVQTDQTGVPVVGMTGGSYGGGIQLTTYDPRIRAIIPEIAWNSLLSSLYPNSNQFKTGFGTILAAALAFTGARVNPIVYQGILTGDLTGYLTPTQEAMLGSVGPTTLLAQEHAATLLFQGEQDVLFPLSESIANAEAIAANPYGVPLKMVWFCGGHGTCDIPNPPVEQDALGLIDNLKWLDQYVAFDPDNPADTIPAFQWYDQYGLYHASDLLPFQAGFNEPTGYTAAGAGGVLGIIPVLGGSGPYPLADLPFSIANAGPAINAVNLTFAPPVGSLIVGAPTVSFSYTGLGTSRTVYAQLVDRTTGLVLGNNVTPIPITLDGRAHTVSIPIEDIAYTVLDGDSLTLQLTSSAANYENLYTVGLVNIADLQIDLPIHAVA